ncbi:hypothetical protein CTI12_AA352540 [Artemisia annua]|uniref:Uncharacterized protein n=1 Tax=Artemisia annua TaxID=35608 RepID=A0A2U1MQG0_ARTAN|nr:hypothetical protein CTI12_AA352540 [Artemisia annua]
MSEMKEVHNHVVEIQIDGDQQKQIISALNAITAIQDHPLMEISESPGHLLLLKLLQREEHLSGRRIALKETKLDTLRREVFQLCLFFVTFHGLFLTILFTSLNNDVGVSVCNKWWIPFMASLSFCIVLVFLVQVKLFRYWKVYGDILKEKSDNRGLTRCIQELRMKGVSFDLSKEPGNGKRMKSSSVEIKWKPITWCSKYFVTICLVLASGLVLPLCKFMICA